MKYNSKENSRGIKIRIDYQRYFLKVKEISLKLG